MTQVEAGPGLAHAVRWNMRLACDTCVVSWCDSLLGAEEISSTLGCFGKSGIEKGNLFCSFAAYGLEA